MEGRGVQAYYQHLKSIDSELQKATKLLEEGDLEHYLAVTDMCSEIMLFLLRNMVISQMRTLGDHFTKLKGGRYRETTYDKMADKEAT